MTVTEFLAWVPRGEWGRWELVDGQPRRRMHVLQPGEIVATTPDELRRHLDQEDARPGECDFYTRSAPWWRCAAQPSSRL
jgi:hypothetical protein